nr:phospholipase-like protein [Tanacetum cinerariifolium]
MDKEASVSIVTIKAKIDVVDEIRKALTPTQQNNPFRNRMLPHIEAKHSVKLNDVMVIFDKMCDRSVDVEDNDAEYTYSQLRDGLHKRKVRHDAKREKGEKIQYTMTGFVWAFMIWIFEAILATHCYVHKQPTEKIPRALAWESTQPFTWSRCCTLFVRDQLAPPLKTLTPTKGESETDWWNASLEYFEGKHVEREAVSQLEFEKDGISEKKKKRGSSQSSLPDPTYDQLMMTVTKLEGTVATLTETVSSLHGPIRTFEPRLLALEGDARVSTLTQTVSSLQGTITTLESRMLALEGDEHEFGVVSDGDIPAYMSPGPRTPLKLKSPMRCYSRKMRCTIPPPASTTMPPVTTISVPMTTTKLLKDTKDAAKDVAKDAAKDTHLYVVTNISVPMTTTEKKTDCYLDCLPKGRTCEPSFWDTLYPGGEKAEYLEDWKLDGL